MKVSRTCFIYISFQKEINHIINEGFMTFKPIFVTLEHKTSHKTLGYIFVAIAKNTLWVKIIHFSFMPKIIRTLSKGHVL